MELVRLNHPKDLPVNSEVANWIAAQFPANYRGFCIDVGASDGKFVNSTWCLEKERMWTVLSVEANPYLKDVLTDERVWVEMCAVSSEPANNVDFHMNLDNLEACSALNPMRKHERFKQESGTRWDIVKVNVRTLDQLLSKWDFPRLDALCVDVEGGEREVLKGLDWKRWGPRAVLVECWDRGGLDDVLVPLGYDRVYNSADNDGYVVREDK